MPKLITTQQELAKYVPNVLASVAGEKSLYEKLVTYLDLSENYLRSHFVSDKTFNTILGYTEDNVVKQLCKRIVCSDAFHEALPSLDLVLTPNGFGIVSNQNVVPASRERVERLQQQLAAETDRHLRTLITLLPAASQWTKSEQYRYFSATLFPFLELPALLGVAGRTFDAYQQLYPRVVLMERELAEKFISTAIYNRLREHYILSACTIVELDICNRLRAIELALLKGEPLNVTALHILVTEIRQNPTEFPEWPDSETASLYTDQSFHNKQHSPGFWF